jgi:predicted DNA-binding transcriptional regulator YafY
MFERDKLELRELGVPIASIGEDGSDESAYTIRTKEFYLPYLGIVSARGLERPATVDRYGYRSLETLAFSPDELEAIVEGARRVAQAGDPLLAEEARSAIRKLAFDLPLGAADRPGEALIARPRGVPDPKTLSTLGDALFRRKQVEFTYRAMQSGTHRERHVEPYGLFFVSGHWYLAARDAEKHALRNFRVSRIQSLRVNASRSGTPDYEIPRSFSLREHAASRQAWEIGDGDLFEAVVEFTGASGAANAAAALGAPDGTDGTRRRYRVRRGDSFARWILSLAGEARPVSPDALVREYESLVAQTREVYA